MKLFERHQVDDTAELQRILALPRRSWTEAELAELARRMTDLLKTPAGTMKLRPMQALALHDLYVEGGVAAMMRVGSGKTLVSLLAAYVVGAKRPILLLPAALINKTVAEMRVLQKHWRIPNHIQMISYEMLGREQGADLLKNAAPDLIIADEVHKLKNKKVGRTRRVTRYLRENPQTKFAGLSGTFMKHSLKDFAHIVRWCLPNSCPLPVTDGEISEWADAVDEKVQPLARRGAGALLKFCNEEERKHPPIQAARLGLQRRFADTPGVIVTQGEQVSCSLYIRAIPYQLPAFMEPHFDALRTQFLTPDGWDLMMATEVYRHGREMALGFHGIWDPRPPTPWRVSRKLWAKFVRDQLSASDHLDTEKQVKNACARGELPDTEYKDWLAMEPTFEIRPKDVWHDDTALKICEKWMADGPGIVWCEHVFFAEELARRTGAPYYRQDGRDRQGNFIEQADTRKPIIASYNSNKEGRNLQGNKDAGVPGFSRNLVTTPPSGADDWEQMLGRTHRDGQFEDEVTCDFLLGCKEHWDSWNSALAGAVAARDTLGAPQKLLLADIIVPTPAEVDRYVGSQWRAKIKKDLTNLF